jgi:hypothetical protein
MASSTTDTRTTEPLQNRVRPDGKIVSTRARGTYMGNRGGVFHNDDRTLKLRHWASKQWICCVLEFKGRHRPVMSPRHYTELFFLDEATALAAGHRPCFECRRADAVRFAEIWSRIESRTVRVSAPDMDQRLHRERCSLATRVLPQGVVSDLPTGTIVRNDAGPGAGDPGDKCMGIVIDGQVLQWAPNGYEALGARIFQRVVVLTPPSIVAVLKGGYRPTLHWSAKAALDN